MEIEIVKIQGQGYLLNGNMSVPKADGNQEYELIKQWLSEGNTPEPEFTEEELASIELNKKISEALAFLDKTDNREFPSYIPKDGENIAETIAKRVEARQFIRENR